jgi:sortase A
MRIRVITIIKKYKKSLLILIFLFGYVVFWWWFFNEKNVAIKQTDTNKETIVELEKKQKAKEQNKKQFTQFSNFWIEINTDNVKIKAPIVEGVTDDVLAKGVGHHKTTAIPNEKNGNVALSGHRWKFGSNPAYKVFEDIDKLKIGDNVIIHYQNKNFEYEITEQKIVNDKAVEILEQTESPTLTFYACTPKYTALKRLVFQAKLVKVF